MAAFLKSVGLVFALIAVITLLIVIPVVIFGVVTDWRVVFLSISYFVFSHSKSIRLLQILYHSSFQQTCHNHKL